MSSGEVRLRIDQIETGFGVVFELHLLFLIQFFHKFELADQRRREGIQRPFRK